MKTNCATHPAVSLPNSATQQRERSEIIKFRVYSGPFSVSIRIGGVHG